MTNFPHLLIQTHWCGQEYIQMAFGPLLKSQKQFNTKEEFLVRSFCHLHPLHCPTIKNFGFQNWHLLEITVLISWPFPRFFILYFSHQLFHSFLSWNIIFLLLNFIKELMLTRSLISLIYSLSILSKWVLLFCARLSTRFYISDCFIFPFYLF